MNIKTDIDMSNMLDSFEFDEEGKSIDKLMVQGSLDGGFGTFVTSKEHKNVYAIGTMVKRDSWVDENGRAQSILGVIDHYDSFSGCYLIKYNNGQGWELILEDDMTKVLWFVM